jgi:hypothetical protein
VEEYRTENLSIDVVDTRDAVSISWRGESDAANPRDELLPYLVQLINELRSRKVKVHFEKLSYMNSATVTPIMEFLGQLRGIATEIDIYYRGDLQWQATSFRAMRVVARNWKNVAIISV